MKKALKIIHVVGARPNFVKIASILRACRQAPEIESLLVHTGQHYSENMSRTFFEALEIPVPNVNLEVGSGSHAQQTAEIMKRFEPVVTESNPDAVLVVGDVNSTIACTLVAKKLGIGVIHVEAGLRSFDRSMPEEINRILTDAISDILFVTEPSGLVNLEREGIAGPRVHFVGNVMIDTLEYHRGKAADSRILCELDLQPGKYVVVTLHRPSNVDEHEAMVRILDALAEIQKKTNVVFPMHPRTVENLTSSGLISDIESLPNMLITEPLAYIDFLKLMSESKLVMTDSGGIQEETTILGIPCLTVRENTERPVTVSEGTNILVGTDTNRILEGYRESMDMTIPHSRPKFWDGKASQRIVSILLRSIMEGRKLADVRAD
ncbi:MAG: UDP-N-acetylglucosamine 2-epimerase (non-hydrolyzing) [Planctomycetes bacterium B3_Pla]|nr:MAG: UDP-N-acetylglucosamine 2-epimerase (non-hydrolyzing) [Planctomycetes bacterium B3_Pla]